MARSRARAASTGASRRQTARSRKDSSAPEVEVVEEEAGMGIDDGILIVTTIVLLTACLMVDYANGTLFGKGMFF